MRAAGIGPILRWVDDHLFIRIPTAHLTGYNQLRNNIAKQITTRGGPKIKGGRSWFAGAPLPNDQIEEFDEDHTFPLRDLSHNSPRSSPDLTFCYNTNDINQISQELGIPWELSKDIPFSDHPTFIGLTWNLTDRTVSLAESKRAKYIKAISEWMARRTHSLNEVQKLHGKLIHAALIFPEGRPYLSNLEAMLTIFGDKPFMPRTPPRGTQNDLKWWLERLAAPSPPSPIPTPQQIYDPNGFSDASSTGIGILLNGRWRAWALRPNWHGENRDIGWAESIGFEFVVRAFIHHGATNIHFKVFGDNQGVIDGWLKGRSRNKPTNDTFKRIHTALATAHCTAHARYIPSASNPADGISRGIYPPLHLLLPPIPIPDEIRHLIVDFDDPSSPVINPFPR